MHGDDSAVLDPPGAQTEPEDDGLGGAPPADPPPAGDAGGDGGGTPPTPPAVLPDDAPAGDQGELPGLEMIGDRELGLKVGGRKPDSAVLKFKGCKVSLTGPKGSQFDRQDRIIVVDIWQVTGDNDQDTIETRTGEVKSTSKTQNATLCGTTRIEDYVREKLAGAEFDNQEIDKILLALDAEVPGAE